MAPKAAPKETSKAPKFFKTPAELRKWLEKNHDKEDELLVGLYKKGSGKPSIEWLGNIKAILGLTLDDDFRS